MNTNTFDVTALLISITPSERKLLGFAAHSTEHKFRCLSNPERAAAVSLVGRRVAERVAGDDFKLTGFGRAVGDAIKGDTEQRRAKAISQHAVELAQLLPSAIFSLETVAHLRGLERELLPLTDALRAILGDTTETRDEADTEERYHVILPERALSRADALDVIWRHTPRDLRGVIDGAKGVIVTRGTDATWEKLDALSYYEIADMIDLAWLAEQRDLRVRKKRGKAIKPHDLLAVLSPDQCAECLDGISEALYRRIWNDIVPLYDAAPRSEVNDDFDERSVARFWSHFTDAERAELNAAAAASDI